MQRNPYILHVIWQYKTLDEFIRPFIIQVVWDLGKHRYRKKHHITLILVLKLFALFQDTTNLPTILELEDTEFDDVFNDKVRVSVQHFLQVKISQ